MRKQRCGVLAMMGAALLCLCACGASEAVSAQASSEVPQTSAPAQQEAASSREAQSASQPERAQSAPLPRLTADPTADPLTGLARAEDAAEDVRPLAVMLENLQTALPQRGLQSADLVYEAVTEGGVTRLMAVFSDYRAMPQTGPVCSAYGGHVQLLLGTDALYLYAGATPEAAALLGQYLPEGRALNGQDQAEALAPDFARGQTMDAQYCWFTDGALFAEAAQRYGIDAALAGPRRALFEFVPYAEEKRRLSGGAAHEVYLRFSGYANSTFTYVEETGQYSKSQFGAPQLDENTGEAVAFDNLLILFDDGVEAQSAVPNAETEADDLRGAPADAAFALRAEVGAAQGQSGAASAASSADAAAPHGGVGCYLCGGRYELVRWEKSAPDAPLYLLTNDAAPTHVAVNPGRSYVAVVEPAMRRYFRIDGADVFAPGT